MYYEFVTTELEVALVERGRSPSICPQRPTWGMLHAGGAEIIREPVALSQGPVTGPCVVVRPGTDDSLMQFVIGMVPTPSHGS